MPADERYEIDVGAVSLEAEYFEWPSDWEALDIVISDSMGWKALTNSAVSTLRTMYNGARGRVDVGPRGLVVQYVEGTGGAEFTVTDWRSNTGTFVFAPNNGLELEEIAIDGSASYFRGRLRLIPIV